tara:strand:- start:509 stop:1309 length:801 start_codon:yes stop_codon:yes gene_type:complete
MSKIKVDTIQSTQHASSTISLTSTGATVNGDCTATNFTGSGANLTSLPSSNLTGALPAIDGSALTSLTSANLTGAIPANLLSNAGGGGGLEFVKKETVSGGQIVSITESGLDYDTVYRVVISHLEFNWTSLPYVYPLLDNKTTEESTSINTWEYAKQVHLNYSGTTQYSGINHWKFDAGSGYTDMYYGGYFDIATTFRPWCIGALRCKTEYGFCQLYGSKGFQLNTNNDPNQTEIQAKCNGFILKDSGGWQIQNGSTYMLYKWKQS